MVSFAKVAEYQRRAAIHFHAVVRLDGPPGPGDPSPDWATVELLTDAVHAAAAAANVRVPESDAYGTELLVFGEQLAVRPIWAFADGEGPTDEAVAAYVAKYVSKGTAETGAGLDYRVSSLDDIRAAVVTSHVRALIATCWRLGGLLELEHLRLRSWAHSLGYRGHILTKSRRYSTTYGALREERAEYRHGSTEPADNPAVITESSWRYIGSGYTPGEADFAASIAEGISQSRELAREAMADEGWAS